MARRIEIELTSARPDGTWTWRAAGALNPRGALDATLLYSGAKAGDVVRAEADFGIDGITVVSIEPPRAPEGEDPNRIQLLEKPVTETVTTQLATRSRSGGDRFGAERADRGARGDRAGDRRPPRDFSQRPGQPGAPPAGSGLRSNGASRGTRPTPDGRRPSAERPARSERAERPGSPEHAERAEHGERPMRPETADQPPAGDHPPRAERPARPGRPAGAPSRSGPGRPAGRGTLRDGGATPADSPTGNRGRPEGVAGRSALRGDSAQRQHRLSPGNAHRNAVLESLPAEQQPIAQQLLRGGIPAVRTALHFEREKAREEGRPEPSTEGVLAIAESLVSKVKAAEWRDRAEAAIKAGDDLAMRDLRSLVSGSDAARDEKSRELVVALREMLEHRVEANRVTWANEVTAHLDEGHVVRALRLSSRPPDPAARFSAELATRLRDAASVALSPSTPSDKWLALLQAVVESPVRRTVKPEGFPPNPSPELLETARQQCGRVPALAPLLGLSVPPPPGPARPNAPTKPPVRRSARPPKPPRPAAALTRLSSAIAASPVGTVVAPAPATAPADTARPEAARDVPLESGGTESGAPESGAVSAEFEEAVGEAAAEEAFEEALEEAVAEAAIEEAVGEAVIEAVAEAVGDAVTQAVERTVAELEALEGAIVEAIEEAVVQAVGDAIGEGADETTTVAAAEALEEALVEAVEHAVQETEAVVVEEGGAELEALDEAVREASHELEALEEAVAEEVLAEPAIATTAAEAPAAETDERSEPGGK